MLILFWIILSLIALCLSYPVFLLLLKKTKVEKSTQFLQIDGVSVILFSLNNAQYLEEKINQILKELEYFNAAELIIIDNESTDKTVDILDKYSNYENVKVRYNCTRKSVACSLNLGITEAKYEFIIFSDLRQKLSDGILIELVMPLRNNEIGAVSACLSAKDKSGKISFIRSIENMIKKMESKNGELIGVYGPLYAIRKSCYSPIPDYIMLEDLYLTLSILKSYKAMLKENCLIYDDSFSTIYNYQRVKRYYSGLFQIAKEKELIKGLGLTQIIMLIWHKYLRLLLPVFTLSLVVITCVLYHLIFTPGFILLGTLLFLIVPAYTTLQKKIKDVILINLYYLGAFFQIVLSSIYLKLRHLVFATKKDTQFRKI